MFTKKRSVDDVKDTPKSTVTQYPTAAAKVAANSVSTGTSSNTSSNAAKSPFPLNGTAASSDISINTTSRLHVGKDIHLKGEITACDRLIVEGKVEASMNSTEIEITESGIFIGEAVIDRADISGIFDGKLNVRSHLIIRKGGRVTGDIQYENIEIEPGGEISGNFRKSKEQSNNLKTLADDTLEIPADTLLGGPTFLQ